MRFRIIDGGLNLEDSKKNDGMHSFDSACAFIGWEIMPTLSGRLCVRIPCGLDESRCCMSLLSSFECVETIMSVCSSVNLDCGCRILKTNSCLWTPEPTDAA